MKENLISYLPFDKQLSKFNSQKNYKLLQAAIEKKREDLFEYMLLSDEFRFPLQIEEICKIFDYCVQPSNPQTGFVEKIVSYCNKNNENLISHNDSVLFVSTCAHEYLDRFQLLFETDNFKYLPKENYINCLYAAIMNEKNEIIERLAQNNEFVDAISEYELCKVLGYASSRDTISISTIKSVVLNFNLHDKENRLESLGSSTKYNAAYISDVDDIFIMKKTNDLRIKLNEQIPLICSSKSPKL